MQAHNQDITLKLLHTTDESMIILKDGNGQLGIKHYIRRIHKYESTSDFKRLSTELQTYGISAMIQEWERIKDKQPQAG